MKKLQTTIYFVLMTFVTTIFFSVPAFAGGGDEVIEHELEEDVTCRIDDKTSTPPEQEEKCRCQTELKNLREWVKQQLRKKGAKRPFSQEERAKIEQALDRMDELKARIDVLDERIKVIEDLNIGPRLDELETAIAQEKARLDALESNDKSNDERITAVEEDLEKLREDFDGLKAMINVIVDLDVDEIKDLDGRVKTIEEEDLPDIRNSIDDIEARLRALEKGMPRIGVEAGLGGVAQNQAFLHAEDTVLRDRSDVGAYGRLSVHWRQCGSDNESIHSCALFASVYGEDDQSVEVDGGAALLFNLTPTFALGAEGAFGAQWTGLLGGDYSVFSPRLSLGPTAEMAIGDHFAITGRIRVQKNLHRVQVESEGPVRMADGWGARFGLGIKWYPGGQ